MAVSPFAYGALTAPAGNDDVVIVSREELMTSDTVAIADADKLSVTLTVNLDEPIAVAVPETLPLGSRLSPSGRDPLDKDHVYGGDPPVAFNVCE